MRPLDEIAQDAAGFSKTEFRYDPPHALDRGVGTVADYVSFEGRLIAVVDGMDDEDFLHVISDDIEPDVAEPMARLLNDVGPMCEELKKLRKLLATSRTAIEQANDYMREMGEDEDDLDNALDVIEQINEAIGPEEPVT